MITQKYVNRLRDFRASGNSIFMCSLIRAQCVSLLSDIRDDYILYIRPRVAVEAKHYAQGSPVQRVRCAALAEGPNGRKHKHQWRIPPAALEKFSALLIARVGDITAARTFAELLGLIKSARTKGVAELTVYDTAVRIGKGQGSSRRLSTYMPVHVKARGSWVGM